MFNRFTMSAAALALAAFASQPAAAASCDPGKAGDELSFEEAQQVYECIAEDLHAGYAKGAKRWVPAEPVAAFPGWTAAGTAPANPAMHGDRFLFTYVNDIGKDEYLKYAENPVMPVGSMMAKVSFSVTGKGKVRKGPLFLMEKVAAGTSPKTDDWFYYMVAPNGRPQAVNVFAACADCHQENFGDTGGMGYPVEEVRLTQ